MKERTIILDRLLGCSSLGILLGSLMVAAWVVFSIRPQKEAIAEPTHSEPVLYTVICDQHSFFDLSRVYDWNTSQHSSGEYSKFRDKNGKTLEFLGTHIVKEQ